MTYELWIKGYLTKFNLNGDKISDIKLFNNKVFLNRYTKEVSFIINEVYRKVILTDNTPGVVNINFSNFVKSTPMTNIMYLAETILGINTTNILKIYIKG